MTVREAARVALPTPFGRFTVHGFECASGLVYLAIVAGHLGDGRSVLARVHSECLTGDVFGSLRCDCGVQLKASLRSIAAEGRGVLVYATGHEGRGIGLMNKLRAYVQQDLGSDTVDANLHLGLPVDRRDYQEAAAVFRTLGVSSVRLITNNPRKVEGLTQHGIAVEEVRGIPVAPHASNLRYLRTKQVRLGHRDTTGVAPAAVVLMPPDITTLMGDVRPRADRPYVVLKYAQSIDGRIATSTGDAKWISGEQERMISHALRGRCDAIMVGVGTVLADDPQLTVRLVAGASPVRVVLDSQLRIALNANVVRDDASTIVLTTSRAGLRKQQALRELGVAVEVLPWSPEGIDLAAGLRFLRAIGIQTLLVEGGRSVITSLLRSRVVDRLIVSLSPIVIGNGVEGIGDLGTARVSHGLTLTNRVLHSAGEDLIVAGDVVAPVPVEHEAPLVGSSGASAPAATREVDL